MDFIPIFATVAQWYCASLVKRISGVRFSPVALIINKISHDNYIVWMGSQVVKAQVCKTCIREFESHPFLSFVTNTCEFYNENFSPCRIIDDSNGLCEIHTISI